MTHLVLLLVLVSITTILLTLYTTNPFRTWKANNHELIRRIRQDHPNGNWQTVVRQAYDHAMRPVSGEKAIDGFLASMQRAKANSVPG